MNTVTFSGLSTLDSCNAIGAAGNLMWESCHWACKHRRPYARCLLKFDPFDRFGMSETLKACWVKETCAASKAVGVSVTCQPKSVVAKDVVAVSGSFLISVDNTSSLVSVAETEKRDSALRAALASMLDGVTETMIRIDSVASSRRLRTSYVPSQAPRHLTQQAVNVTYTVLTTDQVAGSVRSTIASTSNTNLASRINTEFVSQGIPAGSVTVTSVSQPTSKVLDSAELQQSIEELAAIKSLKQVVDQHLQEAVAELSATRDALQNRTLTQHTTADELSAVNNMHAAARQRLQELMDSHGELQQRLQNATSLHNQTHAELANALTEKTVTKSNLDQAQSKLGSTQVQLAAARATNNATLKQLSVELARHNLTMDMLSGLKKNHSAVVQELEALDANHTKAQERVAELEALEESARRSFAEAASARNNATKHLESAIAANNKSLAALKAAAAREETLDQQLTAVTNSLTATRTELYFLSADNNATRAELRRTRLSLDDTLAKLEAERLTHAKTKEDLEKERLAHERTKDELKEEQEIQPSRGVLLAVSIGLLASALITSIVCCCIYRYKKEWLYGVLHMSRHDAGSGDAVVMGRPIGEGTAEGVFGGTAPGKGEPNADKDPGNPPAKGVTPASGVPPQFAKSTGASGPAAPGNDAAAAMAAAMEEAQGQPVTVAATPRSNNTHISM